MKDSFTLSNLILNSSDNESDKNEEDMETYNSSAVERLAGPDKRIISNILSYSRALSVLKTERVGNLNLLMN